MLIEPMLFRVKGIFIRLGRIILVTLLVGWRVAIGRGSLKHLRKRGEVNCSIIYVDRIDEGAD